MRHELRGSVFHPFPVFVPGSGDASQQRGESRLTVAVLGWKIRAGEHGLEVGREEDSHRPSAAPVIHRQRGGHVDVVQIGTLLTVDLDAYEVLVHQAGDRLILERLPLHHMTPVAGRVPDREKNQPLLISRPGQCLFAPRKPIHRVVGMLQEIRARLAYQTIGMVRWSCVIGH